MDEFREVKTKIDLTDIDKRLVQKESLKFVSKNSKRLFNLTDDGLLEVYNGSQLLSSEPFSKIRMITESNKLLEEGYELLEAELELPDIKDNQAYSVQVVLGLLGNDRFNTVGSYKDKDEAIAVYNKYKNKDEVSDCRVIVDTPYENNNVSESKIKSESKYVSYENNMEGEYSLDDLKKIYKDEIDKENQDGNTFEDWLNDMLKRQIFVLKESEIKTSDGETIDTEQEKQNIEQANKEVDEIKKAKEELEDKVDELLDESVENSENEFPSSEFTKMKLSPYDFEVAFKSYNGFNKSINGEQKEWLKSNGYSIKDIYEGLKDLMSNLRVNIHEQVISIDEYIEKIMKLN